MSRVPVVGAAASVIVRVPPWVRIAPELASQLLLVSVQFTVCVPQLALHTGDDVTHDPLEQVAVAVPVPPGAILAVASVSA
ncbi:MAG: hypothetical protein C0519_04590 [Hyphomicrobium sp.]|nr:hypothetical protein [Hyphomicrobium sp.]